MADDEPTNILIVDDLPEKLLVYRTILEELGQHLITASSGEDALRAVLKYDFAVILLDVQMPGMGGLETARLIRQRKRSSHTPIIFLTAFADEVRVAEGYAQGAVDYLTTPVVPAILRAKVRVFADLYRMTQQVRRQAEERIALAEERTKREAAEETSRRLGFLAHAREVLGRSLDQEVTTRDVVQLARGFLAETVALITLRLDGQPARFTLARAGTTELEEGVGIGPLDPELDHAVSTAIANAEMILYMDSALAIPLTAQNRVFAILGFSGGPSGGRFTPGDVALAESYTSRAAISIENARLYHNIQEADRRKNEFLSMLAHELRNPLAPIRNANEILRQCGPDPARVRWAQGVIDRQVTHLVRLVDDLLDVSRLTQGKIRLAVEPVVLETIVSHAVEASRPLIDQFRHTLEVILPPQPIYLQGDPARLTQVLTNLLNNATKYSEPGSRIALTVEREGTRAVVRVRDSGIGISPELLPSVFEPFTQENRSLDRSQGGLGIGLTLVRRLVELHGGSVEARSEGLGRGSEFIVRLPVLPVEHQKSEERPVGLPAASSGNNALRIVVIDDNVDCAESMVELLTLEGHQVWMAHDGPTGIAVIGKFCPDIVLLDIGLPEMDGFEVVRRLRRDPEVRAVLVAVSGYGRDEDRLQAREAGFDHHFVKPLKLDALRSLLVEVRSRPEQKRARDVKCQEQESIP